VGSSFGGRKEKGPCLRSKRQLQGRVIACVRQKGLGAKGLKVRGDLLVRARKLASPAKSVNGKRRTLGERLGGRSSFLSKGEGSFQGVKSISLFWG